MFVIRLYRVGRFKRPIFFIVVAFKKSKQNGYFVERLGFVNPNSSENFFFINSFRLGYWLNRGAKLKPSVSRFLVKFLILNVN